MRKNKIATLLTVAMLTSTSASFAENLSIDILNVNQVETKATKQRVEGSEKPIIDILNINQSEVQKRKPLPTIPVEQQVKKEEVGEKFYEAVDNEYVEPQIEDSYDFYFEDEFDSYEPETQVPQVPSKPKVPQTPQVPNKPKAPQSENEQYFDTTDIEIDIPQYDTSEAGSDWTDWDDFAGFTEFESFTGSTTTNSNFNSDSGSVFDNYDDFGFIEIEKEEHVPGESFIKPKQTFQYTLNGDEEYPVYVDTGVVFQEGTIPFHEDIKEIARQITIRTEAKMISDKSRFIMLLDDNFSVIDGRATDVNVLLNSFKKLGIDLRIQSSRVGQMFNLADHLENEGELILEVNGEKIDLLAEPHLSDSRVLLPIRSIGEGLGANVSWDKGTKIATIKKDNKIIKIESNKDIITVNGKEYLVGKETTMNKEDERILSMVNLIVTELGGEMRWSATEKILKVRDIVIEEDY